MSNFARPGSSFEIRGAVPDIMTKVRLFQDRILTDAERLALATGAATYRWGDAKKGPNQPFNTAQPAMFRRWSEGSLDHLEHGSRKRYP
jgi:hypothetical protein